MNHRATNRIRSGTLKHQLTTRMASTLGPRASLCVKQCYTIAAGTATTVILTHHQNRLHAGPPCGALCKRVLRRGVLLCRAQQAQHAAVQQLHRLGGGEHDACAGGAVCVWCGM